MVLQSFRCSYIKLQSALNTLNTTFNNTITLEKKVFVETLQWFYRILLKDADDYNVVLVLSGIYI